jgi:hypothetical protein
MVQAHAHHVSRAVPLIVPVVKGAAAGAGWHT